MKNSETSNYPLLTCTPKSLPKDALVKAAEIATNVNGLNRPRAVMLDAKRGGPNLLDVQRIAALTTKYWHKGGVALTVRFMDNPGAALRKKILMHMNAWGSTANVQFTQSSVDPQVRIDRATGVHGGYWSYLGTDILSVGRSEPTMNLEGFTMKTPESEFRRVIRHETGHTLGFPHEHMRRALVEQIDQDKAIAHFMRTQGWSKAEVIAQVLTPIEEAALLDPTNPDPSSIMCYQIPGQITKSGQPIIGGLDINSLDHDYAARLYPKAVPSERIRKSN